MKRGGQKRNKNARKYDEPLTKVVVFRVGKNMEKAFKEQIDARDLDMSKVLREYYCRYAGVEL